MVGAGKGFRVVGWGWLPLQGGDPPEALSVGALWLELTSFMVGFSLLRFPAAEMTVFTALIPKS